MKKSIISTTKAPKAIGPYSQAVLIEAPEKFVFASGQIPINPATGQLITGSVEEQTKQVMENLLSVLQAAEMGFENVVKTTIFLDDMNNFSKVNQVYTQLMEGNLPARATVEVARLPKDVAVEIDMTAAK